MIKGFFLLSLNFSPSHGEQLRGDEENRTYNKNELEYFLSKQWKLCSTVHVYSLSAATTFFKDTRTKLSTLLHKIKMGSF